MIKYVNDNELLYKEDVLKHLIEYNKSFTGEKPTLTKYYYVIDNNKLVGSLKATLSWDWVGIKDLFYDNLEILNLMLSKVCNEFKHNSVGIKVFSNVKTRIDAFLDLGFELSCFVEGTPMEKGYYYVDLLSFDITSNSTLEVISNEEKLEEYNEVIKEKIELFNKQNDITDDSEDISVVAIDNDTFVGGVIGEIYKDTMDISLLVVKEEYRKNNVGTKLMTMIEDEAKQKGVVKISLGTVQFQAKHFYEKLGYKVVMTRKDFPKGYESYQLVKSI